MISFIYKNRNILKCFFFFFLVICALNVSMLVGLSFNNCHYNLPFHTKIFRNIEGFFPSFDTDVFFLCFYIYHKSVFL